MYLRLRPQNGRLIKQFLCTAQMQCMTADCQTHDIIMMHSTMCVCNFVPSATIVPALWLSANSTQKFNDLSLDHGWGNHTPMAIFTFSALRASIWYHTWECCAIFTFPELTVQGLVISFTFYTVLERAVTLTLIGNFLAKQVSAKCYSLPIHMPEAPKHGAFMDIPRTPPSKWLSN